MVPTFALHCGIFAAISRRLRVQNSDRPYPTRERNARMFVDNILID
jgi:hypothetical protein